MSKDPDPRFEKMIRQMFKETAKRKFFDVHDHLAERAALARRIAQRGEGGLVAIVYGGVDCDGSRWDDRVALVPASVMAVVRWTDDYHDDAEGPQWSRIESPSKAAGLKSSSRDLALEAFENGHQHVIYI